MTTAVKKPIEADRSPSGNHPAVVDLRNKLKSIADKELAQLDEMDKELEAYVTEVTTPPPPPVPAFRSRRK
jgi:hypothetical protein